MARRADGREDHLDDVGLVRSHDGENKPGDIHRLVGEPAAGNTDREVRVDHIPFRFALLAVQPGRKGLLTLCAIHVTMVAHRIPEVPINLKIPIELSF